MNDSVSIIEDDEPARQIPAGWIARKVVQPFQAPNAGSAESLDLSQREREVLDLPAREYAFEGISDNPNLSVTTVSTRVRRIQVKLHVRSQAQTVATHTHFVRSSVAWHKLARD